MVKRKGYDCLVQLDCCLLEYDNIGREDKNYFRLTGIAFSGDISLCRLLSETLRTLEGKGWFQTDKLD